MRFPILMLLLAASLAAQDPRRLRNRVYARRGERKLLLDVYIPRAARGPRPGVMVIHGGAWRMGSKATFDARFFATRLLREGYVVASINYRLAPRDPWPAQIEDCRDALRYLRQNAAAFHLDAARLAAVGSSAGGHLAALLGTQPDQREQGSEQPLLRQSTRPTCVVAYSAPMNLATKKGSSLRAQLLVQDFLVGLSTLEQQPGLEGELMRRAREASPQLQVSKGSVPLLLVHGTRDGLVPHYQARDMRDTMRRHGRECELVSIEGGRHVRYLVPYLPLTRKDLPAWWGKTTSFLQRHLAAPARSSTRTASRPVGR